ncbi:DNA-binding transcription repressor [Gamsiella multidivaricata]|nr:DNA-binding transcription repressor [Gamsiella multidivaricata]
MAAPVPVPGPVPVPVPAEPSSLSPRRMRFSLSALQSPTSSATAHLSQRDIQALQRKGLLRSNITANNNTLESHDVHSAIQISHSFSHPSSHPHRSSANSPRPSTPSPKAPSSPSTYHTLCAKPPLPIAARVAPLISSSKSRSIRIAKQKSLKGVDDSALVIHHRERPLPAYHQGFIEDTCSHLHVPGVLRRHSDSSNQRSVTATASALARSPLPEDTLAFDPIRRASIATASPTVPTPLGDRTVLYRASQAHTLLALPSKNAFLGNTQAGDHFTPTPPTPEMTSFRFPADRNRSPSPALSPSISAMSPTMAMRSKRKSSIPMRSPSAGDSLDASPGVIFQLPFGTPPLPLTPFRKASTPSMLSLSSTFPSESRGDESSGLNSEALATYPSPASRSVSASSGSGAEIQELPAPSIRFDTPPSPPNRSGLGIQVQESFAQSRATHPLESSSLLSATTNASQAQLHPITFTDEDSTMSIGDIIVAEQASAAHRQEAQSAEVSETTDHPVLSSSMPTPPLTSRVLALRVMEVQDGPGMGTNLGNSLTSPLTPFTPGNGFTARQDAVISREQTSVVSFEASDVVMESQEDGQQEDPSIEAAEPQHDRNTRAGSTSSDCSIIRDMEQDGKEDPSALPLWAQRQLHIRRQSLIPRPELDFVKGSGILPPATKGLVAPGGAVILSYPVLISDMVHVALDELQAKGVPLDGSDLSEESEEDMEQPSIVKGATKFGVRTTRGSKRRKSAGHGQTGKRRGSGAGTKAQAMAHEGEDYQSGDEYPGELEGAEESKAQQGYMSSQNSKRRRLDGVVKDSAELLARTRIVPERHSPSIYRRRDQHGAGFSPSPSTSPHLGSAPFRQGRRVASAVKLDSHHWSGDEDLVIEDADVDDDEIDIDDDEIVHQNREYDVYSRKHQYKNPRQSQVPEHLRIPPSEVEIAVRLTKEMMELKRKRKPNNKETLKTRATNNNHSSGRPSLKALKPLLDATMKADRDSVTEHNNEDDDSEMESPEKIKTIKASGSSTTKKTATTKANSNSAAAAAGGSSSSSAPKRLSKSKEGKMNTKRCEACGATETPCWRPGYTPHSALCNSCGLRYKKSNVFCPKVGCKYIPLKTEYAAMEVERAKAGRAHLLCHKCRGPVALPVPKE